MNGVASTGPRLLRLTWRAAAGGESVTFFKDREPVRLVAELGNAAGASVEFRLHARNPRGGWTWWRPVAALPRVPVDAAGRAEAEWRLEPWEVLDRWAFATFRFSVRVHDNADRRVWPAVGSCPARSGPLRHYATRVGFYGLGPVGERFSNAVLGRLAREAGGVALRRRGAAARRRLTGQVAPGERAMRIFGYSLGGRAAVAWARELGRRGVGVETLLGVDAVDLRGRGAALRVPGNVRRAVNFFQRNGGRAWFLVGHAGRGAHFAAEDAERTAVENREARVGADGRAVMHEDMPGWAFPAARAELTAAQPVA